MIRLLGALLAWQAFFAAFVFGTVLFRGHATFTETTPVIAAEFALAILITIFGGVAMVRGK